MPLSAFVTVGTTHFPTLTDHITSPDTLSLLSSLGITHLTVQHGSTPVQICSNPPILVTTFDYTPSLQSHLRSADLIISHAGAGTIVECVALQKRLLVVVNDSLMHNHQTELANAMAHRNCCVVTTAANLHKQFAQCLQKALEINVANMQIPKRRPYALANVLRDELTD